jgi:hypothetical protein
MAAVAVPWLAFKVMAAGPLTPRIGFSFADALCVNFIIAGMFDFQLADDVEVAVKALRRAAKRTVRPWSA